MADPFDIWKDRKITVILRSGKGTKHLKGKSDPNVFQLVVKKGLGGTGGTAKPFRLVFDPGDLPGYWSHVVLQPMGSLEPPPANDLLPPIGTLSNNDIEANLEDIIDQANRDDTDMMRLEGFIPVAVTGMPDDPKLDEVRIVYIKKVLKDKINPNDPSKLHDYVYINFRGVKDGSPQPNGGGSGPPDG